ncbi:18S rRNA biogenesis protein [Ceraceosorus guamensis]|uniref:18S rRNA biogenesis protein n=1 Tax=Ceraceosorus guamensis TaxID=1522189 RepID=A0A316VT00_9BASI|nr:18S rRNA biogenesis protein [Ceraceosorus guamensis]PWN40500.1 18S rRNA biogenesis protein [Ceraceosorus guamensis]
MPTATASTSSASTRHLRFRGHTNFRQRLILSCLTGRPVRIDGIRPDDTEPGIQDFEAGFLRLIEKMTNGTVVEIGYTGTSVSLRPGTISGGDVTHDCGVSRSVGYYLEWIAVLAPFAKKEVRLTLKGITTGTGDAGVDILRTVTLPLLSQFLPEGTAFASPLELRVISRGMAPGGGGAVQFRSPLLPTTSGLRALNFNATGRVRRIRGVASAVRVSPNMASRLVDSSRGVLGRYIPDLYIFADVFRGEEAGRSPGFALSLVSTSTTGALQCAEVLSTPGTPPEDVAEKASRSLLSEIASGGCVGRQHQAHALLLMACGPEDVSKIRLGALTPTAIQMLRDIKEFTSVVFKIAHAELAGGSAVGRPSKAQGETGSDSEEEEELEEEDIETARIQPQELILTCVGVGIRGARKAA